MYRIGEFSRILSLTVKTLRYYDEAGILTPSLRDEANGYRLYSEADYKKAKRILLLRRLDFSILEIRDVLSGCENPEDLWYYLEEKKAKVLGRIKKDRELIGQIDAFMTKSEQEDRQMNYEITTKTYEGTQVAAIRFLGKYADIGAYFGKIFKAAGGKVSGTPFCIYHDGEYKEQDADIEVCVPVKEPVAGDGVKTARLPSLRAIVTTHTGPYDTISEAYKALTDYANAKGLKLKEGCREIYLKGPGMMFKGNPNKYVTEVAIEIE